LLYSVHDAVLNRRTGRTLRRQYGPGEGEIWMDNLDCEGTEISLSDCAHNGWADHNCDHAEDVSISCENATGKNAATAIATNIRYPAPHRNAPLS